MKRSPSNITRPWEYFALQDYHYATEAIVANVGVLKKFTILAGTFWSLCFIKLQGSLTPDFNTDVFF